MLSKILFIFLLSINCYSEDIKVMIIDTGITPSNLNLDPYIDKEDVKAHPESYVDTSISLPSGMAGHGTFVAGEITKDVCKQVKIYSCNYFINDFESSKYNPHLKNCFIRAKQEKMDFVNFSGGGKEPYEEEKIVIKDLLRDSKTILVTAAGNETTNLGKQCKGYYPACYHIRNIVLIGNIDITGFYPYTKHPTSNYGYPGMKWESGTNNSSFLPGNKIGKMTGTSHSAAVYTNKLLMERCKELNNEY